jgi:3-deoxy-D-manno-octulosonic-acid transferase
VAALLNKLTLIGAQTETEAEHYKTLGGTTVPIKVLGNLKYDWPAHIDEKKRDQLKQNLNIGASDLVLVAGSTHAQEEQLILDIYKSFRNKGKEIADQHLKIIIAPRHPERFDEVANIIENHGFNAIRYSNRKHFTGENDIYILDTIGLLADYYALASVAFVGGSLANVGGHNLLEPYLYAVPVVCGPHLHKTKETAAILSKEEALFIGSDRQEIEDKIITLLSDKGLREQMGKSGKTWLNNNRGAVERSMTAIATVISSSPVLSVDESAKKSGSQVIVSRVNPWHKLKENSKENKNKQL